MRKIPGKGPQRPLYGMERRHGRHRNELFSRRGHGELKMASSFARAPLWNSSFASAGVFWMILCEDVLIQPSC